MTSDNAFSLVSPETSSGMRVANVFIEHAGELDHRFSQLMGAPEELKIETLSQIHTSTLYYVEALNRHNSRLPPRTLQGLQLITSLLLQNIESARLPFENRK